MDTAQIRAMLGDAVRQDGSLYQVVPWISWHSGSQWGITLDGEFTADQLEAIAAHMREHSENPPPK